MKLLLSPVPHAEAAKFISGKPAVASEVFNRLRPELKARAFTITGIEAADALQRARDLIAALPRGADWDDRKGKLLAEISPWLVDENAPAEDREKQVAAASRRAETLMRLHGFQSYAASQWQVMDAQRDVFPFWQYGTFEDARVRPSHAALDGIVLPADHPFWADHFPPWEWGCRCLVTPISAREAAATAGRAPNDPAGWTPAPAVLKRMEEGGMLDRGDGHPVDIRSPRQRATETGENPDAKFSWHPGTMTMPLESLLARYDEPTRAAMETLLHETKLDDGQSLMEWLGGKTPSPAKAEPLASGKPISEAAMAKRVRAVAAEIRDGKNEVLVVLNPDGKERFERFVSGPSGGEIPEAWKGKLAGCTLVHNHPSGLEYFGFGRSLSKPDIKTAARQDLASIAAVSRRREYTMKPGPGGWLKPNTIDDAFEREKVAVKGYLGPRVADGRTPEWKANQEHHHLVWRKVARELGMKYSVLRRK